MFHQYSSLHPDGHSATQEQIDEVTAWRDEHVSEYSPMYIGFTNVFNRWDDENWEPEDE